jgi:hypothetical protein
MLVFVMSSSHLFDRLLLGLGPGSSSLPLSPPARALLARSPHQRETARGDISIRSAILRGEVGAPDARVVYVFGIAAALVGLVTTVLLVRALGE